MMKTLKHPLIGAGTGAILAMISKSRTGGLDHGPVPIDGVLAAGSIVLGTAAEHSGHKTAGMVMKGFARHAMAVLSFRKTDQLTALLLSGKSTIAGEFGSGDGDGIGEDSILAAAKSL